MTDPTATETDHASPERVAGLSARLLAPVVLVALWTAVVTVLEAPGHTFAETRLMPLFAAFHGLSPYAPPDTGPCYVPMYPPLALFFYVPVAFLGHPVAVLTTGAAMTLAAALLPLLLFLGLSQSGRKDPRLAILTVSIFLFWIRLSPFLVGLVYIHADTPAIFLTGLGVGLLGVALRKERTSLLLLSVVVISLAPWAKQTFLPVVLLPPLALLSAGARTKALRALVVTALLQLLWAGLFGLLLGGRSLFFWLVDFAARQPWRGPPFETLVSSNRVLLAENLMALILLAGACLSSFVSGSLASGWLRRPWALLLAAGLILWPSSLVGSLKVGGAINSFLPTTYFISCSILVFLFERGLSRENDRLGSLCRRLLLIFAAALSLQSVLENTVGTRRIASAKWDADVVYKTVRNGRGQFLFPWYPLSTYLASGEFVNSELGVEERAVAGIAVSPEQIRRYSPPHLRFVVCGQDPCKAMLGKFQVVREVPQTGAWGAWTVYEVREASPQ